MKVNPKKRESIQWGVLILSLVIVYLISAIGSQFTSNNVNSSWFEQIKPLITPPNIVFPIVWSILFFLMGISLYFLIINTAKEKNKIIWIFAIGLLLNILWSLFYFSMRNPVYSFIDLILLWISILLVIILSWKKIRIVSYLNIPYLLWLTFAGILNYLSILKI